MQLVLIQLLEDGRVDVALPVAYFSLRLLKLALSKSLCSPGKDRRDDAELKRFPAGPAPSLLLLLRLGVQP